MPRRSAAPSGLRAARGALSTADREELLATADESLGTLATLITDTPATTAATLEAGMAAARDRVPGFLGLHLEGPHLSLSRKGAHDPDLIRPMEEQDLARLVNARGMLPVLMTTVAPETVTPQQIAALSGAGVAVSLGHSDAGFATARAAIEADPPAYRIDVEEIRVSGDRALAVTRERWTTPDGAYDERYEYRFERVDGRWLIAAYAPIDGNVAPIG